MLATSSSIPLLQASSSSLPSDVAVGGSFATVTITANMTNTNIYTQRAELGSATEQVKKHQDTLLDMYDPNNTQLNALLAELVGLELEIEDLDKEFEVLQQRG